MKKANRRGLWTWITMSVMAASTAALMSGCGGGGDDDYYHAWYDVYGNQCNYGYPRPGCNFYYDGDKIGAAEDPYYNSGVRTTFGTISYVDSYNRLQFFTGWYWKSPSNIVYNDIGRALNQDGDDQSLDAIATAEEQTQQTIQMAAKNLTDRYNGLSADTATMIAETLHRYAVLPKEGRKRTAEDRAAVTAKLFGVSESTAMAALAEANATKSIAALEPINAQIASHWKVGQETSGAILKNWFKRELNQSGIH